MFFLEEVKPRIFCVTFHQAYQLCSAFRRYSESYESPEVTYGMSSFTMDDCRESYSKLGQNLSDTYAEDWAGFNLTGKTIQATIKLGISDLNKWDQVMLSIFGLCAAQYPDLDFALIGVSRETDPEDMESLVNHELAHAFYSTSEEYADKMNSIFDKMPENVKDIFLQVLSSWGYGSNALVDETQAYFSTGFDGHDDLEFLAKNINLTKIQKQFNNIFRMFEKKNFKKRLIYPHL